MAQNGKWAYFVRMPTTTLTKQFNTEGKLAAREVTVIEGYRAWSGKRKLGGEIWSLGGAQERDETSEIGQYLNAGFIKHAHQYRGFDTSSTNIAVNRRNWPDAFWHYGDIVGGARDLTSLGLFPDAVFADFCNWQGVIATNKQASGVLPALLDQLPNNPLVIVNVCCDPPRQPKFKKTTDDLEAELSEHVYPRGWKRALRTADTWEYVGKNGCGMMTFWLERA